MNAHVILLVTHLPGTCVWSLDTYFNLLPINHLNILFVKISYQARFCLRISYPVILFTMRMRFFNRGSFIVRALSAGNKQSVHIVSFSLLGARIHIFLPGTQQYHIIHPCHIRTMNYILWTGPICLWVETEIEIELNCCVWYFILAGKWHHIDLHQGVIHVCHVGLWCSIQCAILWGKLFRAIPWENVPYDIQNFATFFSLVTVQKKEWSYVV